MWQLVTSAKKQELSNFFTWINECNVKVEKSVSELTSGLNINNGLNILIGKLVFCNLKL